VLGAPDQEQLLERDLVHRRRERGPAGASFMPLLGIGCVATGQSQAATIGGRSLTLPTGVFTQRLEYGAASAPAAMVLGAVPQSLTLPGLCSALQTLPLLSISGTTDAAGTWNLSLTLGNLTPLPRATVYAQFAFADPGLTHGFGLSSCSPVTLPGRRARSASSGSMPFLEQRAGQRAGPDGERRRQLRPRYRLRYLAPAPRGAAPPIGRR
jgi:hypothetical protein